MTTSSVVRAAQPAPGAERGRMPTAGRADSLYLCGLILFVAGIAVLLSAKVVDAVDSQLMTQVAVHLVDHGSVTVHESYLDSSYSYYGLGMSLMYLPTILVAKVLGRSEYGGAMMTNVWVLAALAGALYGWTRLRGYGRRVSVAVGAAVVLAGGPLIDASSGLGESALALFVVICLIGVTGAQQGRRWAPAVLGAGIGMAVLMREDSVILVLPWVLGAAMIAWGRAGLARRLLLVAAAGLPFLILWAWYNAARYGSPLSLGYGNGNWVVFNHSFVRGVYGMLLSPGIGQLIYVPLTVAAVAGMVPAWRRDRLLAALGAVLYLDHLAFYAPFWGWFGGFWGCRFLLPVAGVLAIGLAPVFERFSTLRIPLRAVIVVLAAAGFVFDVVGGSESLLANPTAEGVYQPIWRTDFALHLYKIDPQIRMYLHNKALQDNADHVVFDWSHFPITSEFKTFGDRTLMVSPALGVPPNRHRQLASGALTLAGLSVLAGALRRDRRTPEPAEPDADRDSDSDSRRRVYRPRSARGRLREAGA